MASALPALLLLSACATPELLLDLDSDVDGLLDGEERELGTDPTVKDTDRDTWEDGIEIEAWTDPLDPDDHPLVGGWDMGPCRDRIEPTTDAVGEIASDFALMDQYSEQDGLYEVVRLHDFCHKEVLIVYGNTG